MDEKQKNGEIVFHLDFSTAKVGTVQKFFYRMKNELEQVEE